MLVLERRTDESIVVYFQGKQLAEISVNWIGIDKVHLGFSAPDEVIVYRKELLDDTHSNKDDSKLRHVRYLGRNLDESG